MGSITPIPEVYNGTRFRSRLEAAWARWFDANKIRWLYESDGYDLAGIWYLLDFYLPDLRTFAEVKDVLDDEAQRKPQALAKACAADDILVVLALPPAGRSWARVTPAGELIHFDEPDLCRECGQVQFFGEFGCRKCPAPIDRPWSPPYSGTDWIKISRWWAREFEIAGMVDARTEMVEQAVRFSSLEGRDR